MPEKEIVLNGRRYSCRTFWLLTSSFSALQTLESLKDRIVRLVARAGLSRERNTDVNDVGIALVGGDPRGTPDAAMQIDERR